MLCPCCYCALSNTSKPDLDLLRYPNSCPLWPCPTHQIALYEDASVPEAQWAEQELYDAALACIWQGYTQRWPHRESPCHSFLSMNLLGVRWQAKGEGKG